MTGTDAPNPHYARATKLERALAAELHEAQRRWDRMNGRGWSDDAKSGLDFDLFAAQQIVRLLTRLNEGA